MCHRTTDVLGFVDPSRYKSNGMETRVVAAQRSDQQVLQNLFQLYTYDFSEILPLDVEQTGRFKEESLDSYWSDAWRFPFLLRADDCLAGFALVHHRSKLSTADNIWDMAEFFVLRKYRRVGVGTRAAHRIFATCAGQWEVRQRSANLSATSFWRRAISAYTAGHFTEELLDDDRWRGPVQRFTAGSRARPRTGTL
jgi:predicted acetyltransferase